MKARLTRLFQLFYLLVHARALSLYEKKKIPCVDAVRMPYRLLYPDNYDKEKKYPAVLFLHGSGERGDNNESQLIHGGMFFLKKEYRTLFPCFVIMPQCPADDYWSSVKIERTKTPVAMEFNYSAPPAPCLGHAVELLTTITREEQVDESRIYIMGISMGGMGVFEAVWRYPNLFAAAVPVCGGADVRLYDERIKNTAFWIFHGEDDKIVDVAYSRTIFTQLKELHADVKYTEYRGVGHNSWDKVFEEKELMKWMFSKSLRH